MNLVDERAMSIAQLAADLVIEIEDEKWDDAMSSIELIEGDISVLKPAVDHKVELSYEEN